MPPVYTVAVAAFAIGVSQKWIDNLLATTSIPGVFTSRQGVQRSVSDAGILALALVRILSDELGVPTAYAAAIVRTAPQDPSGADLVYRTASGVTLHVPVADIERSLRERVRDALEAVPRRRRGRPPGKKNNAGR